MADDRLRHLFPGNTASSARYTNPRRGGGEEPLPRRQRGAHAEFLLEKLHAARQREDELRPKRRAVGLGAVGGITLQFDGEPGHELALESLEGPARDIRLLNVRQRGEVTSATVFVPRGKVEAFVRRVEQYRDEQTKKTGKPKHEPLVASISDLKVAVLDGFWTDPKELRPKPGEPVWWEVWLATDGEVDAVSTLRGYAARARLTVADTKLAFPDRTIVLVRATLEQMSESVELLNCIAELRLARIKTSEFTDMTAVDQSEWSKDLLARLSPPSLDAPAVCILDTGVNHGHPLLRPAIAVQDCQTYDPDWGEADHDPQGHGTGMAGLALFGDLAPLLETASPVRLRHRVESVKMLPPPGWPAHEPRLYGEVTAECLARAEAQAARRKRVVCVATTVHPPEHVRPNAATTEPRIETALESVNAHRGRGKPSSWSSAIDALAAGAGGQIRRLVVLAAGNAEPRLRRFYPDANTAESIHDPAQAWNALTVGAWTDKVTLDTARFPGWKAVAPPGGLSPSSTTSVVWDRQWPLKPDVVLEGGNMALEPGSNDPQYLDDLQLLSTGHDFGRRLLDVMGDTSAAAALAARYAAIIQAEYPDLWPETVRALIVHSADWTRTMTGGCDVRGLEAMQKQELLRTFGFGVPDLGLALWSARNALTLVVEDEIQSFAKHGGRLATNEMRLHELPWPREALEELGSQTVELRVTLSYFIEPSPGERQAIRRYAYASHGLRFDVQTAQETKEKFARRVSRALRNDGTKAESKPDHPEWDLGPNLRHHGSLHSDRWRGAAAALALREHIAVYPAYGWWFDRPRHERWNSRARYSLVVSIRAPAVDVDLYTPVATAIGVPVAVT